MVSLEKSGLNFSFRVNFALVICVACFVVISLRLWQLQIIRGDYFREQSENNRLRTIYIPPPRGTILDRNGDVLVRNRPSFNIELVEEDTPNPKKTVADLADILGMEPEILIKELKNQRKRHRFEPRLLLHDVSRDVVAKIAARRFRLPGIMINVVPAREYVYKDLAAHVLGYIREITEKQLAAQRYAGYRQGELVGQYGVEAECEEELHGKRGVQKITVSATGTRIGEEHYDEEVEGHALFLTLDLDVQKAADEAMREKKGAIVALSAKTGEVLALTSAPAFDPGIFTSEIDPKVWRDLMIGEDHKLTNRAIQGTYHPGSVFKIFMSIAALSEGIFKLADRVTCPGFYTLGGNTFKCHKKSGHGSVNLFEAMVMSCDVYFYTAGQRLGVDRIHDWSAKFGLGEPTGIRLGQESKGLVPSTEWKKRYYAPRGPAFQKWYPGETPSVAIGQGAVTLTPLQIARGLAAVVNGGTLTSPYVVKRVRSKDGSYDDDIETSAQGSCRNESVPPARKLDISPEILARVKEAMVGVVNDPRGTGRHSQLDKELNITVGGKTGTAQVVSLKAKNGPDDHAWFAAYAPADDPEIVVVAIVENGGHGGAVAAPLVKLVMESYFRKKIHLEEKNSVRETNVAVDTLTTPPAAT